MSDGPTAASTSPCLGGRQASFRHLASLRQLAPRALPPAEPAKCWSSLRLDGPIPRRSPCWTALLETSAHGATGSGFHPLRRTASAILRPASVRRDGEPCVHLLVLPRVCPSRFLQTLKGYTAREANRLLGRTGQPFWQAESHDHSVRDDRVSDRIQEYIENNPVKAELVANAEEYPWSSAGKNSRDESRLSRLVSLRHET